MNKAPLDTYEAFTASSRALAHARKFAEEAAKKGLSSADIAAELKRREDAHDAWSEDVKQYHALFEWWAQLTVDEKGSKVGKIAEQAIEQLGKTLFRTKIIGY